MGKLWFMVVTIIIYGSLYPFDFSRAYPIARGGGALLAGLGGIAFLGDTFTPVGVAGMMVVALGLVISARRRKA